MKSPDNPYHAGRDSIVDDGVSLQRKRLSPLEIVVMVAIIGSIFTLLSPALHSGKHAGPTPEWMKSYIVPLAAPLYQKIACTILAIAFCFMCIAVVIALKRTRTSVAVNSGDADAHVDTIQDGKSKTVLGNLGVQKCTNNPMDRSGGSAASR